MADDQEQIRLANLRRTALQRTEGNAEALDLLARMARTPASWRGAVFYGPTGRGKSAIAVHAIYALMDQHGLRCRWISEGAYVEACRAGAGGRFRRADRELWGAELLDAAVRSEVLCVDDFGETAGDEEAVRLLLDLVKRKAEGGAKVILTTNLVPDKTYSGWQGGMRTLRARVGERVWSRLLGACGPDKMVEVQGADWRTGA